MRVLLIGPNLRAGGAERVSVTVAAGLRDRGVDARLLALDGSGPVAAAAHVAQVPFEVVNMRHRFDLARLLRSQLFRGFRPDIVVARGVSGLYVGYALSRWRHIPLVYNEHKSVGFRLSRRREAMLHYMARRVDALVAVAGGQRDEWLKRGYGIDRAVLIPNGTEHNRHLDMRQAIRAELSLREEDVAVMFASRLSPEKRVGDFAAAVLAASSMAPNIVGIVAGDGPQRDVLAAATAGSKNFKILGYRDDVPRLLAAADMLVLSSAREALPMIVLEAMAAGVPVIATAVGDVPIAVRDGVTGLLVPACDPPALADAIVALAADSALRGELGANASRFHEAEWSSAKMVDHYVSLIERVTGRRVEDGGRE